MKMNLSLYHNVEVSLINLQWSNNFCGIPNPNIIIAWLVPIEANNMMERFFLGNLAINFLLLKGTVDYFLLNYFKNNNIRWDQYDW